MRRYFTFLLLAASWALPAQEGLIFPNLSGTQLAIALQEAYRPTEVLSYSKARDTLYAIIDQKQDSIRCAYTGFAHHIDEQEDPSKYIFEDGAGLNCEHIWPQSWGTKYGNAKSDMHHLVAVRASVNQARGNLPYGEVVDAMATHWYYQDQNLEEMPGSANIDDYSELGQGYFEPPEDKKGDIARAMFYVYVIYNEQVEVSFLEDQLFTLRNWNLSDPPSAWEIERSRWIAQYQSGKANPFVLDYSLVERIFEE